MAVTLLLGKHLQFYDAGVFRHQIPTNNLGESMRKAIGRLMAMCFVAVSLAAFAQSGETMKQDDNMKHDDMKQDQMKSDQMKKDDTKSSKKTKTKAKKDMMKKDDMKKDDMKKDDNMKHDDMKKDDKM
jgi:pentapeptide MXKDX repeat protein